MHRHARRACPGGPEIVIAAMSERRDPGQRPLLRIGNLRPGRPSCAAAWSSLTTPGVQSGQMPHQRSASADRGSMPRSRRVEGRCASSVFVELDMDPRSRLSASILRPTVNLELALLGKRPHSPLKGSQLFRATSRSAPALRTGSIFPFDQRRCQSDTVNEFSRR